MSSRYWLNNRHNCWGHGCSFSDGLGPCVSQTGWYLKLWLCIQMCISMLKFVTVLCTWSYDHVCVHVCMNLYNYHVLPKWPYVTCCECMCECHKAEFLVLWDLGINSPDNPHQWSYMARTAAFLVPLFIKLVWGSSNESTELWDILTPLVAFLVL